ncbi:hypothetical protein HDV00_000142 [Rhizophlyctis rosea]|nr:hypothetical protein HDV00_000142 [Rhizophlyctis rosea]
MDQDGDMVISDVYGDVSKADFDKTCSIMKDIGLLQYTMDIFNHLMFQEVANITASKREEGIQAVLNSMRSDLFTWLQIFWRHVANGEADRWEKRLINHAYLHFGRSRIDQLFDIITEYPDKNTALDDLKICMSQVPLKRELAAKLRKTIEVRLLTQNASTKDILTLYVHAVHCLKILDPSGGLAVETLNHVRRYLRGRSDSIRCIIELLLDDRSIMSKDGRDQVDEDADLDDMKWSPEPFDSMGTREERRADLVSRLLDIHDTRGVYVEEFQKLLSEKLLSSNLGAYDMVNEYVGHIETLSTKLGDHDMDQCNVMIKDMSDSRRADEYLFAEAKLENPLHGIIISKTYWPALVQQHYTLPDEVRRQMIKYGDAYTRWKENRHLEWFPNLGHVELDLEFDNDIRSFSVSPGEATTIMQFEHQETWTVEDLAMELSLDHMPELVLGYLKSWQNRGVLDKLNDSKFRLREQVDDGRADMSMDVDVEPHGADDGDMLDFNEKMVASFLTHGARTATQMFGHYDALRSSGMNARQRTVEDVEKVLLDMLEKGVVEMNGDGEFRMPRKKSTGAF